MLEEIEPEANILGILDSIDSAVIWFRTHAEPDLFCVISSWPTGSALISSGRWRSSCPVIFTTAYDKYAIQAFRVNSIDYLLKPISKEALNESLRKYRKLNAAVGTTAVRLRKTCRTYWRDHVKCVETHCDTGMERI